MAPVKSLEVNGKVSTAFKFLIVLKESISTSCIVHIHCRCISAVSLDIYNCSFLCFKLSRVQLVVMCTRSGGVLFSVSDSLTDILQRLGYQFLNLSFSVEFPFYLKKKICKNFLVLSSDQRPVQESQTGSILQFSSLTFLSVNFHTNMFLLLLTQSILNTSELVQSTHVFI